MSEFNIRPATEQDFPFAEAISQQIEESAKARGTGIAKRPPEYIREKMAKGYAIIAIHKATGQVAGFCYIEAWSHEKYVANSGLIVFPEFRNSGLARKIKERTFKLSRKKFPDAKIFGITTSLPVMRINSELGYKPVTFSELTDDDEFWNGCQSCVNYHILQSKDRKQCMCTGMLFDPHEKKNKKWNFLRDLPIIKRLKRIKEKTFLKLSIRKVKGLFF